MMDEELKHHERRAIALVGLMIKMHGGTDGDGLFAGVSRYEILHDRLTLAAEISRSVAEWWDRASKSLNWRVGPMRYDDMILALTKPAADDHDTLRAIAERGQSIIMIARQKVRREIARDKAIKYGAPDLPDDPIPFGDPLDVFARMQLDDEKPAPAAKASRDDDTIDMFGCDQ